MPVPCATCTTPTGTSEGGVEELRRFLAPDVSCELSGRSRVAGEYRGVADVLAHFEQRRRSAPAPEELTLVDVIAGTEHVVALAIGSMRVAGAVRRWETVGVFSVRGRDIVQVRVVPFDQHAFDALRGPERGERRQPA